MALTKATYSMISGAPANVLDYGALGDGTGDTPNDTGDDISAAVWNSWDTSGYDLKYGYFDGTTYQTAYSPYWDGVGSPGAFYPPTPTPFLNTDTWDRIGIQLALWAHVPLVYIPGGSYKINISVAGYLDSWVGGRYIGPTVGLSLTGLVMMRGQEKSIIGAGPYLSNISTAEDAQFFIDNHYGVDLAYSMLTTYRCGGSPTRFEGMGLFVPTNMDKDTQNFTSLMCMSANGMTWRDLWFVGGEHALIIGAPSSDCFFQNTVLEQVYGKAVYLTAGCDDIHFQRVNVGSVGVSTSRQIAIDAAGSTNITCVNSKFYETGGGTFRATTGQFTDNLVSGAGVLEGTVFTDQAVVVGNDFIAPSSQNATLRVKKQSAVVGNTFMDTSLHGCIALGDNTANSAVDIIVSGNMFYKTDATVAADNQAIIAPETGVGAFQAATASVYIGDNVFRGRALTAGELGLATFGGNIFSGVPQQAGAQNVVLTSTATYDLPLGSGIVTVQNSTSGAIAMFSAAANVVTEIHDPSSAFSVTINTVGTNLYYNGGTATYRLQNYTGGSATYDIVFPRNKYTV